MKNNVKDQIVTDKYAIYNGDCMEVIPTLEDESIDFLYYSHHLQDYIIIQVVKGF